MDSSLGDVGMRAKLFETASKIKFFEHHLHLEEDPIHALRLTVGSNFFDLGASFDHAVNVAALSGRLCESFECIPKEVVDVSIAAMFHDIGKIGIPAEILEKPGSLTEAERQIVMSHVILGKEILSQGNTAAMKLAAQVAYCHHERWDGSGYPNRVVGDKIPFAARDEAIKKLTTEMSPYFDPVLLKTFCAIFPDRETILTVVESFRRDFITRTEASDLKDGLQ
jgi:putative nucleotidyltransferase with HDIG domain